MHDIVVEVRTHSSNIVLTILTRKKYKNNSIQEFVTIESWPLIIVYATNQVCIIPLNFNYKEYTFKEVIHTKKKTENRWLLLTLVSTNITAKCQLVFFLTNENATFWRFFNNQKKPLGSSKKRY